MQNLLNSAFSTDPEQNTLDAEYQNDGEDYLWFKSDYNKNINGLIQFKKPDEEKAQQALQELLRSMHFKGWYF